MKEQGDFCHFSSHGHADSTTIHGPIFPFFLKKSVEMILSLKRANQATLKLIGEFDAPFCHNPLVQSHMMGNFQLPG